MKINYVPGLSFGVHFQLFKETESAKIVLTVLIKLVQNEEDKKVFERYLTEIEVFENQPIN